MKNRIVIGVLIFIVLTGGIVFWINQKIGKIAENKELSTQIPISISKLFDRKSANDYPYVPQEVDWGGKYLLFDEYGDLIYNKERNEALDTHKYFPNEGINGIVLVKPETNDLGHYKRRGTDNETTTNKAYQNFYTISYFDKNKQIVMARDTVWGALPKETKTASENQHGFLPDAGMPDEKELIEIISKRIQSSSTLE